MAFTSADLDTLDRCIAAGEVRVRFSDGAETQYRSIFELISAREMVSRQLALSGSAAPGVAPGQRPGVRLVLGSKA